MISVVLVLAALSDTVGLTGLGWTVGVACGVVVNAALACGLSHYRIDRLGLADWVTLARATLAVGVAALIAESFGQRAAVAVVVALATVSLALDAVDGRIARRTRTVAPFGAQFDGEVDAFLILVLCIYVSRSSGVWVLTIGAARYLFLAAAWPIVWMRAPLPPRYWRKFVAATQGIVLTAAASALFPRAVTQAALVGALVLLAESFGRDVVWLWRHRQADPIVAPAVTTSIRGLSPRVRGMIGGTTTVLALLIVWAALVAPDRPQGLTPMAFLRVPVELLMLIVLAVALPRTPRRLLAALIGPALGLVVLLKVLDIGFFDAFARPFDPVGDLGDLGTGVETLRSAIGSTQANLLIFGGLALAVTVLLLTTVSVFRLMGVAAGNRRFSLRAGAALGAVWLLSWLTGAQLLSHTPIGSTSTAGFVANEVGVVRADFHDSAVFARQIRQGAFRDTPANRLLTGLRGKDVLLVFVESYGQVSVQGSSFSPAIDGLLRNGTRELAGSGFSARSAFMNAPGFGGMSWLAHSTLQSGAWANSQERYNELVQTNRFTLAQAFKRGGWRTIDFAPADDRVWPDGTSFYHYDKLYDRRQMGYDGPSYNYAPMPDQFMFAKLQQLELSRTHRRPVFAEVDTVSSHMPWDRIPTMIPWQKVGNGSIFHHTRTLTEPNSFWLRPPAVRAAYARSLEYSLNTLISFVKHYGKKNLVIVAVGDEQPLPIVSGQVTSHDVPISIIAHDPSVIKRISGWGWQPGLLPRPDAPVWRMSNFRDRFLTTYGPRPAAG